MGMFDPTRSSSTCAAPISRAPPPSVVLLSHRTDPGSCIDLVVDERQRVAGSMVEAVA